MNNRLRISLVIFFLALGFASMAQDPVLSVFGGMKDDSTKKKLDNCQLMIFKDGNQFDIVNAGGSGKYTTELPLGFTYDFKFTQTGYIQKIIRVDTRNIPPEETAGGFELQLDVNLLRMIPGYNLDLNKEPIGKAAFDPELGDVAFDIPYTKIKQKAIDDHIKQLYANKNDNAKQKEKFDQLMKDGDAKMTAVAFKDAIDKYTEALAIFADNATAKQKLADAKAKYDAEMKGKENEAKYNKLLAEGQANIDAEKWTEALRSFNDAIKIKNDKFPKEKIYEIGILQANAEKNREYKKVIADADGKFNSKDYGVSIERYKAASEIFPDIAYPKDQIKKAQAAMDSALKDEAERQRIEKEYNEMMTIAGKNLSDKKYQDALMNYKRAGDIKPAEGEPKKKIQEINDILDELAKKDKDALAQIENEKLKKQKEYDGYVQAGDSRFGKRELEDAKDQYNRALGVFPDEQYPKSKIQEIDKLIADLEAEKTAKLGKEQAAESERQRIKKDFDDHIAKADGFFSAREFTQSREEYVLALGVLPDEKYPKIRIEEIDNILATAALEELENNALKAKEDSMMRVRASQDELAALELARLDSIAEADRLARIEQDRLDEEARLAAKLAAEEKAASAQVNEVNLSKEDEVKQYMREANKREIAARDQQIVDIKLANAERLKLYQDQQDLNTSAQYDAINTSKESMNNLSAAGLALTQKNAAETDEEKAKQKRNAETYKKTTDMRIEQAQNKVNDQKKLLNDIPLNDKSRKTMIVQTEEKKDQAEQRAASFAKTGDANIKSNQIKLEIQNENRKDVSEDGEEAREKNATALAEQKEIIQSKTEDDQKTAAARTENASLELNQVKKDQSKVAANDGVLSIENQSEIDAAKNAVSRMTKVQSTKSANRAYEARQEAYSQKSGAPKDPTDYAIQEGKEDLKEGITENSYEIENHKQVIERTIRVGNKIDVYKMIVSKTGTYYFKNGKSITESLWKLETLK
jgi:hypothetical protein